jgi:hypothetical protein
MGWFAELKPKQIKELMLAMPSEEATRYLAVMEPEQVARLVGEFKTSDEKASLNRMFERIRRGTGTGAATNPGAALSVAAPAEKAGP